MAIECRRTNLNIPRFSFQQNHVNIYIYSDDEPHLHPTSHSLRRRVLEDDKWHTETCSPGKWFTAMINVCQQVAFTGPRYSQRDNYQCVGVSYWRDLLLQLGARHRMVVHAGDANFILVSRSWEVLHASLVAHRDRSPMHYHIDVLHRITDGDSYKQCRTYNRRCIWLRYDGSLRLFRVLKIHRLEERWTGSRYTEPINNHNNIVYASIGFSCLINAMNNDLFITRKFNRIKIDITFLKHFRFDCGENNCGMIA